MWLPHLLLVVMKRWNRCVNWPGWLLLTYSNTVMLKDTQVSTFVMTSNGIHHCQFWWIFDMMKHVGTSMACLGRKQKILVKVGPGISCTGPTICRHFLKHAILWESNTLFTTTILQTKFISLCTEKQVDHKITGHKVTTLIAVVDKRQVNRGCSTRYLYHVWVSYTIWDGCSLITMLPDQLYVVAYWHLAAHHLFVSSLRWCQWLTCTFLMSFCCCHCPQHKIT
jgi:hypothetical protein